MLAESIDRWNREIREKARQEGLLEGRQEEGDRLALRIVLRQLRLKFGSLDPEIEARVRSADLDRLQEWSERIVMGGTLQDIFRD